MQLHCADPRFSRHLFHKPRCLFIHEDANGQNTCRQLVLRFANGAFHRANFKFRR